MVADHFSWFDSVDPPAPRRPRADRSRRDAERRSAAAAAAPHWPSRRRPARRHRRRPAPSPGDRRPGDRRAPRPRTLAVEGRATCAPAPRSRRSRYNAVQTRGCPASSPQMITASERLDTLNRISARRASAEATRRISAIYKAGGGLSLYATVLDGTSPDDMMTRLRTVQSLVDDDYDAERRRCRRQVRRGRRRPRRGCASSTRRAHRPRARGGQERAQRGRRPARQQAAEGARRRERDGAPPRRGGAGSAARPPPRPPPQTALGTTSASPLGDDAPGNPYAAAAIAAAASKIGLPYVWGGNRPQRLRLQRADAVGVQRQAGLSIMRVAADQYRLRTGGRAERDRARRPRVLVDEPREQARRSTTSRCTSATGR